MGLNNSHKNLRRGRYRRLAVLSVAAAILSTAPGFAKPLIEAPAKTQAVSPLGAYLAGRHAQYVRDPGSAIDFYRAALKTFTGNKDIITAAHMAAMKHNAIVGNIGHFDNEIDMLGLSQVAGIVHTNIKNTLEHGNQVDQWTFPDGHAVIILAEGRLLNLGCATGHPSFVMSASFTNQVMAQVELFQNAKLYENKVYTLPKHLDEHVARLHLDKLGVKLTVLTDEQSEYLGIPKDGPYKADRYRY